MPEKQDGIYKEFFLELVWEFPLSRFLPASLATGVALYLARRVKIADNMFHNRLKQ
jgi:hypothetical protein